MRFETLTLGKCIFCGEDLEAQNNIHACNKCSTMQSISRKTARATKKARALFRLANGNAVTCAVCGCSHEEALTFGHPNGDGKTHRDKIGKTIIDWVLKTPIEEALKKVRIECVYCNFVQQWTGKYPPPERQPNWK